MRHPYSHHNSYSQSARDSERSGGYLNEKAGDWDPTAGGISNEDMLVAIGCVMVTVALSALALAGTRKIMSLFHQEHE